MLRQGLSDGYLTLSEYWASENADRILAEQQRRKSVEEFKRWHKEHSK